MSEFSDSYHLRTRDPARVIQLLRAAKRYGAVLPTSTGFVPFLVEGAADVGGVAPEVLAHNAGVLVHYAYAEDHGLVIRAFENAACVATIDIQRRRKRGDGALEPKATATALARIRAIGPRSTARIENVLRRARDDRGATPLEDLRDELVKILRLAHVIGLSCSALSHGGEKELLRQFPGTKIVMKSRRHRPDKETTAESHEPNEWCPRSDMPAFMYMAVPDGTVDKAMLARHLEHWLTTGDWDVDAQTGFWLHSGYRRALPAPMHFLADRIMNLWLAFGDERYTRELERTLRGILAVAPRDFDWNPYLARKEGAVRL